MDFRWIGWNEEHATQHGCSIAEVESVTAHPPHRFPRKVGKGKLLVIGRGQGGRLVRVIYSLDDDGTAFVIHTMPPATRRRR